MIVELEIKDLTTPQGLLPRVITGTVEEKVKEYAEMIEQGVEFDPITVWRRPDGSYWIVDGVHRTEAHKRTGKQTIKAKLIELKDELEYRIEAIKANLKHGLPLQKSEKVILAQTLYKLGLSIEEIRKLFGISQRTVYYWIESVKDQEKEELKRKAMELRAQGLTQEEVAKRLGVAQQTISAWEAEYQNLQKLQNLVKPPTPTPIQMPYDESEITEEEWQELEEAIRERKEREKKERENKGGRPPKTPFTEEEVEERLYVFLLQVGIHIGWESLFGIVDKVVKRVREYSQKAIRGW